MTVEAKPLRPGSALDSITATSIASIEIAEMLTGIAS